MIQFLHSENEVLALNPQSLEWSTMRLSILNPSHNNIATNQVDHSFVNEKCACTMFPDNPNMMLVAGCGTSYVMIVTYDPETK